MAVADLDASMQMYIEVFGALLVLRVTNEEEGLDVALLRMGEIELELLAALREESPVGKFIAKRGPGLHHVAYAVPDIVKKLDEAQAAGLELIDTTPRIGMHGVRIAFIHPKSAGGVLTELVEA